MLYRRVLVDHAPPVLFFLPGILVFQEIILHQELVAIKRNGQHHDVQPDLGLYLLERARPPPDVGSNLLHLFPDSVEQTKIDSPNDDGACNPMQDLVAFNDQPSSRAGWVGAWGMRCDAT